MSPICIVFSSKLRSLIEVISLITWRNQCWVSYYYLVIYSYIERQQKTNAMQFTHTHTHTFTNLYIQTWVASVCFIMFAVSFARSLLEPTLVPCRTSHSATSPLQDLTQYTHVHLLDSQCRPFINFIQNDTCPSHEM